jgi:hypothetical protein
MNDMTSWQEQIVFSRSEYEPANEAQSTTRMKPGLPDTSQRDLREKASVRGTPIPPDCMGLEGEYDPFGLAKRVAQALDERPKTAQVSTLTLEQQGNTIIYDGQVADRQMLDAIVDVTRRIDGTHAIETDRVRVVNS